MITIQEVAKNLGLDESHTLVQDTYKELVIEAKGIYIKRGSSFFTKEDILIMKNNPTSSFGLLGEIEPAQLEKNKVAFSAAFGRKVDLETAFNNSIK